MHLESCPGRDHLETQPEGSNGQPAAGRDRRPRPLWSRRCIGPACL